MARRWLPLLGLAAVLAGGPPPADAQSVRITGSTSVRVVQVRPLLKDSVPADQVSGQGLMRRTEDGRIVRCVQGDAYCRGTRPADPVSAVPVVQDVEVGGWGLGEGISAYAHLRARGTWGGDPSLWPRAEDALDVLAFYGELDRERFRVRAGRQWQVSGLGFYNFDGVALAVRPLAGLFVEGYGGRSLVRGLNEPRTGGALEAIEDLAPVEPGLLLGIQTRYRPSPRLAVGALYQRDIRDDRAGIYSEVAAADGVYRFGDASVEGSLEADVARGEFNLARLRVRAPPIRRIAVAAEVRRYRPYFELWTIWGAFSPVGFDEARLDLTWARPDGMVIVRGGASYRSYGDPGMTAPIGRFRTDGWGVGANASWAPAPLWRIEGGYRLELGLGAARSEGHAGAVRRVGEGGIIALRGLAFQRLYEFRVNEGAVLGLGAEGSVPVLGRGRVIGDLTGYRHVDRADLPDMDWTQFRAGVRMNWVVGAEPGARR